MIDDAPDIDFLETLPFRGRILVRRLESFGDIVVGFSISELALQLGLPKTPSDLTAHPLKYLFFFATFTLIATAWMRFHRMLTMAFAPGRIDLACAFAYLAFTALLPYALYASAQISHDLIGAKYGLAAYTICLTGSSTAAFILTVRAVARARGVVSSSDFARLRQRAYIEGCSALALGTMLVTDLLGNVRFCWLVTLLIPVAVRIIRRRIKAPGWTAVHVTGSDPQAHSL